MKAAIAAILTVIIMSLTASSGAQIYKCTDEHGNVRFSTKPGPGCKLEAGSVSSGVICNKFNVNAKRTGSTLHISLSTDLPDDTIIMVSISRSYWEKGKETEYAQDYFSGKSTVGEWRKWHKFEIYNEKWVLNLQRHRKKLSRISLGFGIDYISDNIRVRMIVPINQKNAQFGKGNVNLSGSAVETDGLRVIRGEKDLYYPVNSMEKVKRRFPSLDPLNLEKGDAGKKVS